MKRFLVVAAVVSLRVWSARASFTVQANQAWQHSNLPVVAGQWYTLTASGLWTGGGGGFCGPTGINYNPGYNVWVSGPHWSALVASIGQIASTIPPLSAVGDTIPVPVPALYPFLTGDSVTFQAGSSGDLYFTINDDASGTDYTDNSGTLDVDVQLIAASLTGHVYCSCDNSPIAGATVLFVNYGSAISGNDGSYSISIPPGPYSATVTANNYAASTTAVTIPSGSLTHDFPLTPNGYDIATLNAIVPSSSVTTLVLNGHTIQATFTPGILGLTVAQAACRLGYHHFNWQQEATSASYQGTMNCSANPWFSDPPTRYCDPNAPYNGEQYKILITQNNVTHTEYADTLPFYYNEHTGGTWDITDHSHYSSDGTQLYLRDSPSVNPLAIVNPSYAAYFVTSLVGVRNDGTYDILPGTFIWDSDYSGWFGGVNIICASDLALTNGTGGITNVQSDIQPAGISPSALVLISQTGGTFPVTIQPSAQTVVSGANVTFAVFPTNASSLLNYQWRMNGTNISSATNVTLQLPNVTTNNIGHYDAVLSNSNGSIASAVATLTVVNAPLFRTPVVTTNSQIILTWITPLGENWQLQYKTNLNQINWINIGSALTASNTVMSVTDAIGSDTQRFYRVQQQ